MLMTGKTPHELTGVKNKAQVRVYSKVEVKLTGNIREIIFSQDVRERSGYRKEKRKKKELREKEERIEREREREFLCDCSIVYRIVYRIKQTASLAKIQIYTLLIISKGRREL